LNAQVRTSLLLEPRPSDADDVRVDRDGLVWRCCWIRDGRIAVRFGPGFMHVAEAAEAARLVREGHGLT